MEEEEVVEGVVTVYEKEVYEGDDVDKLKDSIEKLWAVLEDDCSVLNYE